jgi:hypothetical protein
MIPFHFASEGTSIHTEKLGCLNLIPFGLPERAEDQPPFNGGDHVQIL